MFDIKQSGLPGCCELIPIAREDPRGRLVKTFHQEFFAEHGLATHFAEAYFSESKQGVLRGLHFQVPPHEHTKLVYCITGEVTDAVVDLRVGSPTFGKHTTFTLSAKSGNIVHVPAGFAHGFLARTQGATVVYLGTTVYHPESDSGIRWDSCEISWPASNPLISDKDSKLKPLAEFQSPFRFHKGF